MATPLPIQVRPLPSILPLQVGLNFHFIVLSCRTDPPFDRHDWVVRRQTGEEVRYVIDYYSAPPEPDGSPVFSLDVRPALDSVRSVKSRIAAATEDVWSAFRTERA